MWELVSTLCSLILTARVNLGTWQITGAFSLFISKSRIMIIGVPKEIKNHEYRVRLIPAALELMLGKDTMFEYKLVQV